MEKGCKISYFIWGSKEIARKKKYNIYDTFEKKNIKLYGAEG